MVMAILGGVLFFVGGCFIIATKENMVASENITKFRIIGACIIVSGIAIWAYLLITYGDPSTSSIKDVLTPLFIAAIIVCLGFVVYFFAQEEKTKGVISLVVLALVIGGATIAFPSNGSQEGEDAFGHDWAVAMTVAEKAVKAELKSPSSAEFSSKNETTINVSGNTWTVSGWVEAQNSFGATIRNSYSVKFTFTSSDKYTIEYCNIN